VYTRGFERLKDLIRSPPPPPPSPLSDLLSLLFVFDLLVFLRLPQAIAFGGEHYNHFPQLLNLLMLPKAFRYELVKKVLASSLEEQLQVD
jgi:hypothetical protein